MKDFTHVNIRDISALEISCVYGGGTKGVCICNYSGRPEQQNGLHDIYSCTNACCGAGVGSWSLHHKKDSWADWLFGWDSPEAVITSGKCYSSCGKLLDLVVHMGFGIIMASVAIFAGKNT